MSETGPNERPWETPGYADAVAARIGGWGLPTVDPILNDNPHMVSFAVLSAVARGAGSPTRWEESAWECGQELMDVLWRSGYRPRLTTEVLFNQQVGTDRVHASACRAGRYEGRADIVPEPVYPAEADAD